MMNDQIKEIKDIISKIESIGYTKSADRLKYLANLPDDEFEDGELRLKKESVIGYYNYLLLGNYFDIEPNLTLSPSGRLGASWKLKDSSYIGIEFVNEQTANWGYVIYVNGDEINSGGGRQFKFSRYQ